MLSDCKLNLVTTCQILCCNKTLFGDSTFSAIDYMSCFLIANILIINVAEHK